MKRQLFNVLSTLALILCVSLTALWIRAQFAGDIMCWSEGADDYYLATTRSHLHFQHASGISPDVIRTTGYRSTPPNVLGIVPASSPFPRHDYEFFGHHFTTLSLFGDYEWAWFFPFWQAILLTAALPAIRSYRACMRPVPPGHCRKCGYDMRATPERCPECGALCST